MGTIQDNIERLAILGSLYDRLATQNPKTEEEILAVRTEIKLTKIELLKTILQLKRSVVKKENEYNVG